MQRSSAVLLVAGAAGLLVLLGVLVRAVHSGSPEPTPTVSSDRSIDSPLTTSSQTTASGPVASRTPDASGRRPSIWHAPGFRIERTDESTPAGGAAVAEDNAPPASRGNTKDLHFGGFQLRTQAEAVRPLVEKCVTEKGQGATGATVLTYVVAKHGGKVEVEDTGIDDDKTTLQNTELLDCLRETARKMTFEGLPREASGLVVTRSVTLESGKLVEYKHVGFSYLR
jgi:hypothetical protein